MSRRASSLCRALFYLSRGRSQTIGLFFGQSSITQPQGLFFTGLNDRIEFFNCVASREKLRLRRTESDLGLLAGLANFVCHMNSSSAARQASRNKKGQANVPDLDWSHAFNSASTSVVKGKQIPIYAA
jgi:hypothetical protein